MADSKVSELTSATSLGAADAFYVVQSNTSKKITAATLFENAANVRLKGTLNLDATVQSIVAPGQVDLSKMVTHLAADASGGNLSIPNGTVNQVKYIVMTSTSGGTYTLRGNVANNANVVFSSVGDTAQLLFTNNKWFMVGGTASLA